MGGQSQKLSKKSTSRSPSSKKPVPSKPEFNANYTLQATSQYLTVKPKITYSKAPDHVGTRSGYSGSGYTTENKLMHESEPEPLEYISTLSVNG